MNISPLDIRKHEFRKVIRGFDSDEVSTFLDMVSMEYENLVRENALLTEKVENFDSQLKKYRDIESTLQETLLSAQRAREDTLKTAKKQAEVIIREAEVKAASIIEEGRNSLTRLKNAFTELKVHKDTYLTKIKALTHAQLEVFERYTFSEEEKLERVAPIIDDRNPVITLSKGKKVQDHESADVETDEDSDEKD
ncbi:MAG: DivIVA domain-containing protein [Candidatus Latescibacteria bacterium]|nr:DivIVA domain-containing protein [Candidatus Latescibacterota bacterium]